MSKRKFFSFVMAVAMIFTVCTVGVSATEESVLCGHADAEFLYTDTVKEPVPMVGICWAYVTYDYCYCPACDTYFEVEVYRKYQEHQWSIFYYRCEGGGFDTYVEECYHCGGENYEEGVPCVHGIE